MSFTSSWSLSSSFRQCFHFWVDFSQKVVLSDASFSSFRLVLTLLSPRNSWLVAVFSLCGGYTTNRTVSFLGLSYNTLRARIALSTTTFCYCFICRFFSKDILVIWAINDGPVLAELPFNVFRLNIVISLNFMRCFFRIHKNHLKENLHTPLCVNVERYSLRRNKVSSCCLQRHGK